MHGCLPVLVNERGGGAAPELCLNLCLCLNHSANNSIDILLQQSNPASEQRASAIALATHEESLSDHDASSAAGLCGQEGDADDLGVHCGGGASGDDRAPGGGMGLGGRGRAARRGFLRGVA